ncbi:septum formation inhibitor Maf [Ahniella affigens]|uniref:dTTP/UTP pyrophosphatase n=1 Tax=Ahniella affigens TaxID=2021234 RepID=A0A2P1PQH2_9GAMM|nr:Maf family protein [Ahniella affigens]AVP97068.1 septum formation inhibitor Maf [Ahniella affigens]
MTETTPPRLFLASQSPRRQELLSQIGVTFAQIDAPIDEVRGDGEPPLDYVRRVAREKAGAGWLAVAAIPGAVVLAADTEVVLDGRVYGKPASREEAEAMLRSLSGRTHQVISAVAVMNAGREQEAHCITTVRFAAWSESSLQRYLDSGESFGKAGAYAIQGRAAAMIDRIEGSYSGVMGLPLFETAQLLRAFGLLTQI